MATVTGFTASRMISVENASVVGGTVVGDDLILTTHGGSNINAGNVRGPAGAGNVPVNITTQNLNSIWAPGAYTQNSSGNSTLARNYPLSGGRGVLEVISEPDQFFIYQRFTVLAMGSYSNQVYVRTSYNRTFWTSWSLMVGPGLPYGRIKGSSTQTISNFTGSNTKVTLFDNATLSEKDGVSWDNTNKRFTVLNAGIYNLFAKLVWQAQATAVGYRRVFIYQNGSSQGDYIIGPNTTSFPVSVEFDLPCASGDLLEVYCSQTSGGNLNLINNFGTCEFQVKYSGA